MNSLNVSINAVLPFVIYLSLGVFLKRCKGVDEVFFKQLNAIVFSVFFPFTMFNNIHNISIDIYDCLRLVCVCLGTLFLLIFISFVVVCKYVKENEKRGVIIQALYRSNTLLYALPLIENLFGVDGLSLGSVIIAFFVPIYNVVAIVILEYFNGGNTGVKNLVLKVFRNPLFQGAIVGALFAVSKIKIPHVLENTIGTISSLTTPLALIVLGGTTKLVSIKKNMKYLFPTLTVKMVIVPLLALVIGKSIGFDSIELFIYFILFATPVAVSSFSMAANMGGDSRLAGEFVSVSTVASVFTLFVWILFLTSFHLI